MNRSSQVIGASLNYSPELEASDPNLHLLGRIAQLTSGKVLDPSRPAANPFYDDRRSTYRPFELWENLIELAIVLFVADVGVRRINPDQEQLQRASHALFWFRRGAAEPTMSSPAMASLLSRRRSSQPLTPAIAAGFVPLPPPVGATPAPKFGDASTKPASSLPEPPPTQHSTHGTTDRLLAVKRRTRPGKH